MFSYINPSPQKTIFTPCDTCIEKVSVQFSSVAQLCPTPCDLMKRSRITLKGKKIEYLFQKGVYIMWSLKDTLKIGFSSVQLLSRVRLFATSWIAAHQASLSITNSRSSLRLMSIELVMPSSHLILCHPLLLLPPIPPSIRVFSSESTLRMRWPKNWSFSFSINVSIYTTFDHVGQQRKEVTCRL